MIDQPRSKTDRFFCKMTEEASDFLRDAREVLRAGLSEAWHRGIAGKLGTIAVIAGLVAATGIFFVTEQNKPPMTYEITVKTCTGASVMTSVYTTEKIKLEDFLAVHEPGFNPEEDVLRTEFGELIARNGEIEIVKPITVYIHADGETREYTAQEGFIAQEALTALGIKLGDQDVTSGEVTGVMKNGEEFTIQRVRYQFDYEEEKIPYGSKLISDNKLTCGKVETVAKGRDGVRTTTYMVMTVDGEEKNRVKTETKVTTKPKDEEIHYGTMIDKSVPEGLEYVEKLEHCKCVSYNYSTQRYGVYGLDCDYGTCAVDRSLIPLGSKLYICGYGYCIANDVGSAIKGKKLDLYMPVRAQCGVWGAQWCDVYILSYGSDVKFEARK